MFNETHTFLASMVNVMYTRVPAKLLHSGLSKVTKLLSGREETLAGKEMPGISSEYNYFIQILVQKQ